MRLYSALAWLVVAGVVVQAGAIAFGMSGMLHYVSEGGVVDQALVESRQATFEGDVGFAVHAINGGLVLPLAALLLLVVSFFTRVRGAKLLALGVFLLVLVQWVLGYAVVDAPLAGLAHGANALLLLLVAAYAALRPRRRSAVPGQTEGTDGRRDVVAS